MEFEIADEPQGEELEQLTRADGGLVEDHIALKNQSGIEPDDYPSPDRKAASFVRSPE